MAPIPRRFRRPKAELRIELPPEPPIEPRQRPAPNPGYPADSAMGQSIRLQVSLRPLEPLQIRRGRLELSLRTTRFAPTVLDGYREHPSERIYQTIALCENAAANPGAPLLYDAELPLPAPPPPPPQPIRQEWQAVARFEVAGRRELRATRILRDVTSHPGGPPIVDGRNFLPL